MLLIVHMLISTARCLRYQSLAFEGYAWIRQGVAVVQLTGGQHQVSLHKVSRHYQGKS